MILFYAKKCVIHQKNIYVCSFRSLTIGSKMKMDQSTILVQLLKCLNLHDCVQNMHKLIIIAYQTKLNCNNRSLEFASDSKGEGWCQYIEWQVKRGTAEKGWQPNGNARSGDGMNKGHVFGNKACVKSCVLVGRIGS